MPAKTPIYLKSTNSRKGKKCRLRDILSPDMISPPLGDFRHTIHIGKGGERDAFGDMSFLQGKYDLLPGTQEKRLPQCVAHNEFLRAHSTSEAPSFEASSPVLKNAISLPAIGGSQALTLPIISTTPFPPNSDPFDRTDPPAPSLLEKDITEPNHSNGNGTGDSASQDSLSKASGSLLSLELDLGPSILDEVLNVMDGTKTEIKL
uniref:CDC42 effector protein (Rho GTPase binding) 3 n=1 Tax=Scleropages formosus TaxID=113540 RepID=A0A8C9R230_SCLFO